MIAFKVIPSFYSRLGTLLSILEQLQESVVVDDPGANYIIIMKSDWFGVSENLMCSKHVDPSFHHCTVE